jgi:hypothetical protein
LGIYYTDSTSGELRIVIRGTKPSNSTSRIPTQDLNDEQIADMATTMAIAEATSNLEPVSEPDVPESRVDSQRSPHIMDELPSQPSVTEDARVADMATTMAMVKAISKMIPGPLLITAESGPDSQQSPHIMDELPPPPSVTQEAIVTNTGGPRQVATASTTPESGSLDANAEEELEEEYHWWMEVDYKMGMDAIDMFYCGTSR